MLNCRQSERLLSAFADQELTGRQMLEVRDHVSRCPDCARELEALRSVKEALAALPAPEPDPGLEGRLKTAVFSGREPGSVGRLRPDWGWAVVSFGLAILAWGLLAARPTAKEARPDDVEAFRVAADSTYVVGSDPFGSHVAVHPVGYQDR
jgi:anti-sigma factor RsiW